MHFAILKDKRRCWNCSGQYTSTKWSSTKGENSPAVMTSLVTRNPKWGGRTMKKSIMIMVVASILISPTFFEDAGARVFSFKWWSPVLGDGQFNQPLGIAIDFPRETCAFCIKIVMGFKNLISTVTFLKIGAQQAMLTGRSTIRVLLPSTFLTTFTSPVRIIGFRNLILLGLSSPIAETKGSTELKYFQKGLKALRTPKQGSSRMRSMNKTQILIGGIALLIGLLVYVISRPLNHTYLGSFIRIPDTPSYWNPRFLNVTGGVLPSFVHVFAFSLLMGDLLACRKTGYLVVCSAWLLIDVVLELGQGQAAWTSQLLLSLFSVNWRNLVLE
jgi:hypothetical protein